jgi:hypothetical protein
MEFVPLEIRWHGRGGYGAKTAALLLAEAVIDFGGFAQASPEFGPERRGAPVQAYTRISPQPVRPEGSGGEAGPAGAPGPAPGGKPWGPRRGGGLAPTWC